jgi:hypothetical protein
VFKIYKPSDALMWDNKDKGKNCIKENFNTVASQTSLDTKEILTRKRYKEHVHSMK